MNVIILIASLVLVVVLVVFVLRSIFFTKNMVLNFKRCNVIVYGKKGTGKDLIFNKVINSRKEEYYANIPYNENGYNHISIKNVSVAPNTYDNFLNEDIKEVPRFFKENTDIYISDGGNYLPSQYDTKLYKQYPSLPIYYALSRHSANHNVHVNTQNLNRVWKALREQADYYIRTIRTIKLPFILITKCITYDNYESANKNLLPLSGRIFNKFSKAEVDQYNATNGEIKKGYVIQLKRNIHYDTRAFEKVLYGKQERIKPVKLKKCKTKKVKACA